MVILVDSFVFRLRGNVTNFKFRNNQIEILLCHECYQSRMKQPKLHLSSFPMLENSTKSIISMALP
jgi:hypothetical protein